MMHVRQVDTRSGDDLGASAIVPRNLWMTAHEAQAYGLVQRVIEHVHEV